MEIEVKEDFDVKNLTSFKIGGKIRKVYFPKSAKEFEHIISIEKDFKVFGNFSNTLVSSDGYDGVVILTTKMDNFDKKDNCVISGCGLKGPMAAKYANNAGLSGFEFMIGFPGTIGGNVYMNASAHGQSISDCLTKVQCWSKDKGIFYLDKKNMNFAYRTSICQTENIIILGAEFLLKKSDKNLILQKMNENLAFRKAHQPSLAQPNCGSVFRNPENNSAGKLLEEAGAKEFSSGGVKVWENHANFIVNTNNGNSMNVLELMYKMYAAVKDKFGILLQPEVKYLGNNNLREVELCKTLNIK